MTLSPERPSEATFSGISTPSPEAIAEYASRLRILLTPDEVVQEVARVSRLAGSIAELDEVEVEDPSPSRPGRRHCRLPAPDEDPYNAVVQLCWIEGSEHGPLTGMRVAVKDSIAIAGMPTGSGEPHRNSWTPGEDAIVIERLLEAGASIVAKTAIDGTERGPTINPLNSALSAGGSSSGSAAIVAANMADAALGVDQGGSIRLPSAWCGLVGLKPTHGLVPTHGLEHWDHSIDHIGPMTATVAENARILQVIAGPDRRDAQPRSGVLRASDYTSASGSGVRGLRIGVIADSTLDVGCTPAIIDSFEDAQETLRSLGAEVNRVSIPMWRKSSIIWLLLITAGLTSMAESFRIGYGQHGRANADLVKATAERFWQYRRPLLFDSPTYSLLLEHLREAYEGVHIAQAQNLRVQLGAQIDGLLSECDLLITPTTPTGAQPLPRTAWEPIADPEVVTQQGSGLLNCCATNLTGHPALTIPSAPADHGLPGGLQLIGRHFDERTLYQVALAFEEAKGLCGPSGPVPQAREASP